MVVSATISVLDVSSGRVIWRRNYPLRPGQQGIRVQFAPDGTLVTSAQQGDTLLWNGRTGRLVRRFPFGGEPAVSANGRSLAVARTQVGNSFPPRPDVITEPVFEPNGRMGIGYLADAAEWPMNVGARERFACQVAGRDITRAE